MLESDAIHVSVAQPRAVFQLSSWESVPPASSLPAGIGAVSPGNPRILCVRPREWFLIADDAGGIQGAFAGCALVNLSDALTLTHIAGPAARDVLSKGCGLDLHPQAFVVDQCARTRFAQIAVLLDCRGPHEFDLYCARSYQEYLTQWLREATLE